ncbi:MAG: response regulator [Desulfobacterales bacterium]|nr:response regulator [Desulfobacterales bacterium]MCP4162209.1 response regulator [Deltaproteobacteria bacterium]
MSAKKHLPVLFVDDDSIAHDLIDHYLEGWKVHHSYSAEDALELMEKENISIVITDIFMEEMDGIDFTKKIKILRNTVQVIIITGDSNMNNLINALDVGANDFLVKPLKKETLLDALESTEAKIIRWKKALKDLFSKKRK